MFFFFFFLEEERTPIEKAAQMAQGEAKRHRDYSEAEGYRSANQAIKQGQVEIPDPELMA